jgi:hypothetical protein
LQPVSGQIREIPGAKVNKAMRDTQKRNLLIFIGGTDDQNGDYSLVHRLARRGGTASWASLKGARPGDRVLIYIRSPHSALVAKAEVLANPVKGRVGDYPYRAKTGRFRLLPNPLNIQDLKREFPRWAWLRYPRSKAAVPQEYAEHLWRCVHDDQTALRILNGNTRRRARKVTAAMRPGVGGGFGEAKNNALVEAAALRKVTLRLERRGFTVRSRESERIGYDLDATKGRAVLHVEVKGVSGDEAGFVITRAEVAKAGSDPCFRLMVVTGARRRAAKVQEFRGRDLRRLFQLKPVSYFAKRK